MVLKKISVDKVLVKGFEQKQYVDFIELEELVNACWMYHVKRVTRMYYFISIAFAHTHSEDARSYPTQL